MQDPVIGRKKTPEEIYKELLNDSPQVALSNLKKNLEKYSSAEMSVLLVPILSTAAYKGFFDVVMYAINQGVTLNPPRSVDFPHPLTSSILNKSYDLTSLLLVKGFKFPLDSMPSLPSLKGYENYLLAHRAGVKEMLASRSRKDGFFTSLPKPLIYKIAEFTAGITPVESTIALKLVRDEIARHAQVNAEEIRLQSSIKK